MNKYTDTETRFIIAVGELLDETSRPTVNPYMVAKRTGLSEEEIEKAMLTFERDGVSASVQTVLDRHIWLTPDGWSLWNWLIKG